MCRMSIPILTSVKLCLPRCREMMIIGIDPGSRKTGYGIIEREFNRNRYVSSGCIHLEQKLPLAERLLILADRLEAILQEFKPDCGAIEEIFFSKNAKSALVLGHARGIVLFKLAAHKVAIYEYTPLQVKQTVVGAGRASKDQVQHMVRILINQKQKPMVEDESDALAVAITHSHFIPHLQRYDRLS